MSDKVQVKVIEAEGVELKPGAKYIFAISPKYADYIGPFSDSLHDLIGPNFVVWTIDHDRMKVYEVLPDGGASKESAK